MTYNLIDLGDGVDYDCSMIGSISLDRLSKRIWFPTGAGWVAYGVAFWVGCMVMAGYPHPDATWHTHVLSGMGNSLVLMMGPSLILGGVATHIWSAVLGTRALMRGTASRGEAIIASALSWGGVGFTVWVAVCVVAAFVR